MYLPGCPPRPEMLIDAILKIHDQISNKKLGAHAKKEILENEQVALKTIPLIEATGLLR
jgi:NADH-quinone oxidoreductase subunit B